MTNFRKSLCSSRRLLTGSVIDSVTISKLVPRSVSQCNLVVLLKKYFILCVCVILNSTWLKTSEAHGIGMIQNFVQELC